MNVHAIQQRSQDGNDPGLFDLAKIAIVRAWLFILNATLSVFGKILFLSRAKAPKNIVIYKLGNIGDVICAMPAMLAIRKNYPGSRVTLLTSPGKKGAIGAKDFLDGASYLDEVKNYYSEDVDSFSKIRSFVSSLKKENYDLFIQLPDDWASFRVLLRNLVFAKAIGARFAFGFRVRTSNIFRRAQVDYTLRDTESIALLKVLAKNGITHKKVKFEFPERILVPSGEDLGIGDLKDRSEIVIGVCMGGKTADKRWPAERFGEVFSRLGNERKIGAVFFGGSAETETIETTAKKRGIRYVNFAGRPITESIAAIRRVDMFLTNDTGPMHIAAAFGIPTVALFNIRTVLGGWFPYGDNNICLYKRRLACDYSKESCLKESLNAISVEEVVAACEKTMEGVFHKKNNPK